eukprot:COSAG06_NODE_38824_length_419_cov_1.115625_1_plen_59_part_00
MHVCGHVRDICQRQMAGAQCQAEAAAGRRAGREGVPYVNIWVLLHLLMTPVSTDVWNL